MSRNRLVLCFLVFFPTQLIPLLGLSESKPFKIGIIQSLSGIAAEDGVTVTNAVRLAAEELNAATGNKIELLIEDDQSVSKNTVSAYQKLKSKGIDALIGATWDFTTNPLIPLAARDQIVLFSTSTLPESLDLKSSDGYGFVNAMLTKEEAKPFADYLSTRNPRNLIIVYANNSWGEAQLRTYHAVAEAAEIEVLDTIKPATYDANEWREVIPRIKARDPELVLLLLNRNDLDIFLTRSKELGLTSKIFASKNLFDAYRFAKDKTHYKGSCYTYPALSGISADAFSRKFQARFADQPRIYAGNSYDAIFILDNALKYARATTTPLKEALRMTTHKGVVGEYRFTDDASFCLGKAELKCF